MKRSTRMFIKLLVVTALGAGCAPTTRPLEHSPSELAWDAWLQQGAGQAAPPRRITTKSLFVFPHLGPESLPACAEGYRPDSMGRCVKVVKVDENAHLEFLLQRLNSQFATQTSEGQEESYDYDIETEAPDTSGPFQFSIPLALQTSGSKLDNSEATGEFVIIAKKPSKPASDRPPTSSPEVVPEDSDKKQFFLDNVPAASDENLQQNHSVTPEDVSVLIRNSTGITLITPTNGKFKNVTSEAAELVKELEGVKVITVENPKVIKEAHESAERQPLKTIIVESSFVTNSNTRPLQTSAEKKFLTQTTISSVVNKTHGAVNSPVAVALHDDKHKTEDSLVSEIESLKIEQQTNGLSGLVNRTNNSSAETAPSRHVSTGEPDCSECALRSTLAGGGSKVDRTSDGDDGEIEDKIKKISQYADVSRNTEGPVPNNGIAKPPNDQRIKFPPPVDQALAASSSSSVRFPTDRERLPSYANAGTEVSGGMASQYPQRIQAAPAYPRDRNHHDSGDSDPPYWLPYGWNVNNPSGEHNLMDLWSRMSSMQRYPYNVRFGFGQERHPHPHRQATAMYPRAGVGAGASYRQGREEAQRRSQLYQDEYKRSRHPHSRESEELSRILEAFNGR